MRVLAIQKVKGIAGSEKYFIELHKGLKEKGFFVDLICIFNTPDRIEALKFVELYESNDLPIHYLEVSSDRSIFKVLRFIKKIYRSGSYNIVHSHLIHADFWSALLKKRGIIKVPLVSTKHGYEESYIAEHGFDGSYVPNNKYFKLCKFAEKQMDRSYAVSHGLKSLFVSAGISQFSKVDVIHHGFDLPTPNLSSPKKENNIVVLGRVIPFKGHHLLIKAFAIVVRELPSATLTIVGGWDNEYKTQLDTLIQQNNLENSVEFTGFQTSIYEFLGRAEIMAVPSISEGFGLVFLEAMNAELPIIGFDVPATNEIVLHQETGLLSTPFEINEFANQLLLLLRDQDLRTKYGMAGKERLKTEFSEKTMLSRTYDFYQSMLS